MQSLVVFKVVFQCFANRQADLWRRCLGHHATSHLRMGAIDQMQGNRSARSTWYKPAACIKHHKKFFCFAQKEHDCTIAQVLLGRYDERCDVWSIGVVSFVLCTGGRLSTRKSRKQIYFSDGILEAQQLWPSSALRPKAIILLLSATLTLQRSASDWAKEAEARLAAVRLRLQIQ